MDSASAATLQNAFRHFQQGRLQEAEELARRVLSANPREAALLEFVGVLCYSQHRYDEAERLFSSAIQLKPNSAEGHYNLANTLLSLHRSEEAVAGFRRSLALRPRNYDTLNALARALIDLGKHKEAEAIALQAIGIAPKAGAAYFALGMALRGLRRFEEAVTALSAALKHGYPDPGDVCDNIGQIYLSWDRHEAAIEWFSKALKYKPKNLPESAARSRHLSLLYNLAQAEDLCGRYRDAARDFANCLSLSPGDARFLASLMLARLRTADWQDYEDLGRLLAAATAERALPDPYRALVLCDDPALHLKCASACSPSYGSKTSLSPPATRRTSGKVRVGYISNDFGHHATAILTAGLFEHHDRSRFELFAYTWNADNSDMRRRLERAFEHFTDVQELPEDTVAARIRDDGIDIAVDLKGYTAGSRPSILAGRPAPIQINFLGFPGTMGAPWVDYIIADHFVIPPGAEQYYSEKVVYLPHSYQVNDSKRKRPASVPDRTIFGLPQEGVVFACFNATFKLTPELFRVWMRLLARVPNSVLWLYRQVDAMGGRLVEENLRREAEAHGVEPSRLVFAQPVQPDDHVQRVQCADLFLDTLPYNAHTTASDALWAGVPVVTLPGRAFQARVAGSLLRAAGLPELIASSLEEYESIAFRIATDGALRAQLRQRIGNSRSNSPLFDTQLFTSNLEAAYEAMFRLHSEGKAPQCIDLAAPASPA